MFLTFANLYPPTTAARPWSGTGTNRIRVDRILESPLICTIKIFYEYFIYRLFADLPTRPFRTYFVFGTGRKKPTTYALL